MSSENGVWVARATQQERGLNEDESGGRKRLERRGTSVSRKGSLRRGGRKKSFICSFIWIIGEKVELGLVNWLVFKCLTLRGFLKGNFSVTKERLKAEVETEINRLGRASLVDIASAVGVELVHCERVAEKIVAEKPDLTFVQGEIVADSYWDTVAKEVNEALQESGQVVVGELAKRFNVGSELLTRVLESRIGKLIQGKLEAGQLYTPAHVSIIRAVVRGAVRALTVPTALSAVWSCLQKQLREGDDASSGGVSGEGVLFQSVLSGLIADDINNYLIRLQYQLRDSTGN
ncbi:hypothetical protein R1flu_018963 [Riccia fluitans]|uniref:E3 UFM1-protein ligase 1-like N-terminal domain-containing protein n=1 Tax=Riccia fluitans TaxID=41844 RepID=A0ABD1ZHC2_9MARC